MGSTVERSKKKVQLWKKAAVHFGLCFIMGFFTGFAPTGKSSMFPHRVVVSNRSDVSPRPSEAFHQVKLLNDETGPSSDVNPAAVPDAETTDEDDHQGRASAKMLREEDAEEAFNPRRLLIIVSPTSAKQPELRRALLVRLASTLRLVPQPLLCVVVEKHSDSDHVSEILRNTGIMYRHLVFKENFTDFQVEMDHQRNMALKHIEHHRLSGIVHFAALSNVYDLKFFEEIRSIEAFGTWPVAFLSPNRNRVPVEGPVCGSSYVKGWHLTNRDDMETAALDISSFAFNSTLLWDPERWGQTSPSQDSSQDPLEYVKKAVLEEETQLKGFPSEDCSKILVWNLRHIPS